MHRIDLRQNGNIGNRMIQYAFAEKLSRMLHPCEIINVDLPEWGLVSAPASERSFDEYIAIDDFNIGTLDELVARVRRHSRVLVELRGFFQDLNLLPDRAYIANSIFPSSKKFAGRFKSNELVINIRAGEILGGVAWYPIVPPQFYVDLVKLTGLVPVFVGQITPSQYLYEIRKAFPNSEFIGTGVPMDDLELVRSAPNICLAVSTFSWLAAWLSEAANIFYPLHGCLHPHLTSCYEPAIAPTNLVPVDDARYRFFLFPLTYGQEQNAILSQYSKAGRIWREIPAQQVTVITEDAPFVPVERVAVGLDPVWYARTYLDAAMEIAEGWYQSPYHHYAAIGHLRGYQPRPPLDVPTGPNIARGKRAVQSSISEWSAAQTEEADAQLAIDDRLSAHDGFHTGKETNPWWLCDLGSPYLVEYINIYNRNSEHVHIRQRALPLLVERSVDGIRFEEVRSFDKYYDFGGRNAGPPPLQIHVPDGIPARYLKLTAVAASTYFHLSNVEVFAFAGSSVRPPEIPPLPPYANVALTGRATQSSLSEWSRGSLQEEAYRAIIAPPGLDYSFHTALEERPWWSVDLVRRHEIREIRLFNRQGHRSLALRLSQFQFQVSEDELAWAVVYEQRGATAAGGLIDGPLIWQPNLPVSGRYFRLQLLFHGILHFNRIEIYGQPITDEQDARP